MLNTEGNVLLVNKPFKWTSFDVIKKLKNCTGIKKIGHAGTLDPLATGLLIICTGRKTKEIEGFQNLDKEYIGKMIIGKTTPSYDLETAFDSEQPWEHIKKENIIKTLKDFEGEIEQIPPAHSAVKIEGKRAYLHARKGRKVILRSRIVTINVFKIHKINLPEIEFKINCSKGTYIRSLVHDFGKNLGTGAYLASLSRTAIGEYKLKDALEVSDICQNETIRRN